MSNFIKLIKKLNKTSRGKAIIKLSLWAILFIFLILCIRIMPLFMNTDNKTNKEVDVITLLTNLNNSNYDFIYDITINDEKYYYEGTKFNEVITGYYSYNKVITKYSYENNKYYDLLTSNEIESVYSNINSSYLDIELIINNINNLKGIKKDNEITYNLINGLIIIINYDNEIINTITLKNNFVSYVLKYKNINKVGGINH